MQTQYARKVTFSRLRGLGPRRRDYAGLRTSWKGDVIAGLTVGVVALAAGVGVRNHDWPRSRCRVDHSDRGGPRGRGVRWLERSSFGSDWGDDSRACSDRGPLRRGCGVRRVDARRCACSSSPPIARIGRYLAFIPWPVVEGFTVGIAVIIFFQQVPAGVSESSSPRATTRPSSPRRAVVDAFSDGRVQAIGIVVARRGRDARPAAGPPLPARIADRRCRSRRSSPRWHRWTSPDRLVAVLVAVAVVARHVDRIRCNDLFSAGIAVALLAAIESLLSARVADGMSDAGRHDPDRELFGQGLANLAAPLFGGMPATGAIARTAVNVRAGARTRVAAVTHADRVGVCRVLWRSPRRRDSPCCAVRRADGDRDPHGGDPQRRVPCCARLAQMPSCWCSLRSCNDRVRPRSSRSRSVSPSP